MKNGKKSKQTCILFLQLLSIQLHREKDWRCSSSKQEDSATIEPLSGLNEEMRLKMKVFVERVVVISLIHI